MKLSDLWRWDGAIGRGPYILWGDFLVTRAGEFLLEPLPGGRTRLTGTTWYSHRMWPAFYWRIWSDSIIHAIHGRVLEHIKRRAGSP